MRRPSGDQAGAAAYATVRRSPKKSSRTVPNADALATAADLVKTGGAPLARHIEAGRETAARWSHAAFRTALEAFWMTHAPEARLREGPLDPP